MHITRVETIPIRMPRRAGLTAADAEEPIDAHYVFLRLHTDAGPVGLGEATVTPSWSGETARNCVAALERLVPVLVGADPTQVTAVCERIDREPRVPPFVRAAVEMALWDLSGKAAGVPVYQLLGGKVCERVAVQMTIGAGDVDEAVRLAEQFLEAGARALKLRVGVDRGREVERVGVVRSLAGDEVALGIDAVGGWNALTAREAMEELEACYLGYVEQPIAPGNTRLLARLREGSAVPIVADESVVTLADAWTVASAGAAQVFSVSPGKNGGIGAARAIAHVARAAGLACQLGGNFELGVGAAAMLHLAVAVPEIMSDRYPADLTGPLYHESDLLIQPLTVGPEAAVPPDGPGLGVELNPEQVERWRE
jgi:muconate cycloisomerase